MSRVENEAQLDSVKRELRDTISSLEKATAEVVELKDTLKENKLQFTTKLAKAGEETQ